MKYSLPLRTALFLLAILVALPVHAKGSKAVGPFPVREPEGNTPLAVMYSILKAGVETDEAKARKDFHRLVLKNRKPDPAADKKLTQGDWEALRLHAQLYLLHDVHGFKVWVEEMNPGPAFVNKKTNKVYITLRNKLEGDERRGLMILEKNKRGKWRLRSLNL